jgi:hypothetical protein
MTKPDDTSTVAGGSPLDGGVRQHEWDDDGCCTHCGFDGAEWNWWRFSTYEGRAQPHAKRPPCRDRPEAFGLPPYPSGDVVGPCVCGSWPGGRCLRCPVLPNARLSG